MGKFDDKVALVTGAASGIGRASAQAFAREGASVIVADIQFDADRETVRLIEEAGGEAKFIEADISKATQAEALIAGATRAWGRLDYAHNNAGVLGTAKPTHEIDEADWDRLLAINLKGVWLGMKHSLPHLIANGGGSIITTASISAFLGMRGQAAYGAAKGGVVQLTRVCAVEYADQGVRVNCICPGGTLTPLLYDFPGRAQDRDGLEAMLSRAQPIPRAGLPEDIAQAALWLASDESSFVTGQAIIVDGGWTASARTPAAAAPGGAGRGARE